VVLLDVAFIGSHNMARARVQQYESLENLTVTPNNLTARDNCATLHILFHLCYYIRYLIITCLFLIQLLSI